MTACYNCDKTVKEPVTLTCSKDGVRFTVSLHETCVAAYKRSLSKFGSKVVS